MYTNLINTNKAIGNHVLASIMLFTSILLLSSCTANSVNRQVDFETVQQQSSINHIPVSHIHHDLDRQRHHKPKHNGRLWTKKRPHSIKTHKLHKKLNQHTARPAIYTPWWDNKQKKTHQPNSGRNIAKSFGYMHNERQAMDQSKQQGN